MMFEESQNKRALSRKKKRNFLKGVINPEHSMNLELYGIICSWNLIIDNILKKKGRNFD